MPDLPEHIYEAAHKAHLAWAAEALGADTINPMARLTDVAVVDAVAPLIRAQVADEIAAAILEFRTPTTNTPDWLAYDHAAGLARLLRVPDCGDQYHGADGGPCGGCGFDVADPDTP